MMDGALRETRISAAFVAVVDILTADFDAVELLHTLLRDAAEILDMSSGGLMLSDGTGELHLVTSTSEQAEFVELIQMAASAGPCIECFTTGKAVAVSDIQADAERWPEFRRVALSQGFRSALATPMRLRGRVIGTMNLFGTQTGEVSERNAAVAQALADVATIGILQERVIREAQIIEEQLHRALDSRIIIEQAKGMIASSMALSMDDAFALLRKYARDRNLTTRAVAESVSERKLSIHDM